MKAIKFNRKKTLPVPGDVFVVDQIMVVISQAGYSWVNPVGKIIERKFFEEGSWTPSSICNPAEPFFIDCDYLGNALTGEWENG